MDELNNKLLALKRGYYCPSFFKLNVQTGYNLDDLNILPEEPFSTFFHEYIHFLQDITTTYGLMNCCVVVNRIKYANESILKSEAEKSFIVPFDYTADEPTISNKDIQNIYLGTNPAISKLEIREIQLEESSVELPQPYNKKLRKVVIYYQSINHSIDSFDFGALCIIETMAHIAQKSINPSIEHDDVPYKAAQIVAQNIYPIIGNNSFFTFSLCDACLMVYHPADAFYHMLELMKKQAFEPITELDIYNFVYNNTKAENISLQDLFSQTIDKAIKQVTDYFRHEIFVNERKWVEYIYIKAKEIRLKTPDFMLQIIKKGRANTPEFAKLIDELGTPFMTNIYDNAWFNPPKELRETNIQIDRFAAIREIFSLYEFGKKNCDLKNYCKQAPEGDITDLNCDNSPWERSKQQRICAYCAFWSTWGLTDYKPN